MVDLPRGDSHKRYYSTTRRSDYWYQYSAILFYCTYPKHSFACVTRDRQILVGRDRAQADILTSRIDHWQNLTTKQAASMMT
jgi:hypothetical protein